jgi:gliding motility-associated-like protein
VINDVSGCKGSASFTLKQPDQLQVALNSKTDLLCFGQPKGRISVSGTGGISTEPYSYQWSNGQDKPEIENILAGEYMVTLTDANQCHDSLGITLTQPDSIHVRADVTFPFCPSSDDGEIKLDVSGGTGSYRYLWNNTGGSSPSLIDIKSATYICHITDDNNCIKVDTFYLLPRYPICLDIPNAFSPNEDQINDTWIIKAGDPRYEVELKDMYPSAIIEVFTRWGTLVYRSQPGYPVPWDGTYLGRTLPIDSYYFVITPNNGDAPMKGIITIVR